MWGHDPTVYEGDVDEENPVSSGRWRYAADGASICVDLWDEVAGWAEWVVDSDGGRVWQGRATGGPLPALLAAVVLHAAELGVVFLSAHERARYAPQAAGVDLGEWR